MRTRLPFLLIALYLSTALSAQVTILTQGFEALPFPPAGWSNARITGPSLPGNWARVTTGTYPVQAPHGGSYELRYNSHNFLAGTSGDIRTSVLDFSTAGTYSVAFWMYRDNWSGNDKLEVYVNTTQTSVGGTLMGTVNRDMNQSPFEASNGWYHYSFTVPGGFTGTTNYIILKATSAYGNDIYIDDITVDRLPPAYPNCISAFTPASGTTGACMNMSMDWTSVAAASGYKITLGSNSPSYNNVANNIDIAASISYSTVLSAVTTYGWKVIPYNAFGDATGCPFYTFTTGSSLCYCTPVYVDGDCSSQDFIDNFYTTGGTINISNMASGCTTNPDNFTYYSTKNVTTALGATFTVYMQSGIDYAEGFAIWIDWNQDGDFSDAGEYVYASASATTSLISGTVTVPMTAATGTTRMRVRCAYNYVATIDQSCTTFTDGETEDYNVIIPTPVLPITVYDFYGHPNLQTVDLGWTSYNEINTNYFTVEKSTDGAHFNSFSQMPAAGNSVGEIKYYLNDDAPFPGMNYYRLSAVDLNGQTSYSKTISVDCREITASCVIYPNPASDKIHISLRGMQDNYRIRIFDLSGKLMYALTVTENETEIPVGNWQPGMYIVRIENGNSVIERKITVQ